MRAAGGEGVDNGVLDRTPFAVLVLAATGLGEGVDAVEHLAAPVARHRLQLFPEQSQGLPVGGDHLARVALHEENRRVDRFKRPG